MVAGGGGCVGVVQQDMEEQFQKIPGRIARVYLVVGGGGLRLCARKQNVITAMFFLSMILSLAGFPRMTAGFPPMKMLLMS